MENQVKLSCFSPVSVHLEILLQLFSHLHDKNQIWQQNDMKHKL